jgi:hypothetical protein
MESSPLQESNYKCRRNKTIRNYHFAALMKITRCSQALGVHAYNPRESEIGRVMIWGQQGQKFGRPHLNEKRGHYGEHLLS